MGCLSAPLGAAPYRLIGSKVLPCKHLFILWTYQGYYIVEVGTKSPHLRKNAKTSLRKHLKPTTIAKERTTIPQRIWTSASF